MPAIRPSNLPTTEPNLRGFVHTDRGADGSAKFDLASVAQRLAARAPADTIQMDGATTNRSAGIYGPFDATTNRRGWIADVPVLTVLLDYLVPASNVAVITAFWYVGAGPTNAGPWDTRIALTTGGALEIDARGAIFSDRRVFSWSGFRATYSGQRVHARVVITRGTANPVVEINGVDVSSSFSLIAVNPPDWLSASLAPLLHQTGYNYPALNAPTVIPILGTLTDAEAETWRVDGRLPAWVVAGGSAVVLNTGNFTNFSGMSGFASTPTSFSGTLPSGAYFDVKSSPQFSANPTEAYIVEFTWNGSIPALFRIGLVDGGSSLSSLSQAAPPVAGVNRYLVRPQNAATNSTLGFAFSSNGLAVDVTNISFRRAGALTIPVVQPCLVVGDGTLIGDNCGRILGGVPVTSRDRWRIVARTHTTSVQDVQLLGGNIFLEANRSRIDSVAAVQNSGGDLNLQLGSASAGSNIVASTSIVNGAVPTELAPALRYVPTQTLWARRVAGAGTAPFTITIDGHRVGGNP
jgi:hypothetical protein